MKTKVFFILLVSLSIVFYLFYSMDYSALEKENPKINNIDTVKQKTNNIIKKEPVKPTKKIVKAKEDKKNIENKKKINKDIEKSDVIEKEENSISIFSRNIFKQFKEIIDKEPIEKIDQKAIDREQYINALKSRLVLNFVMLSDFDKVALINRKKFRVGDIVEKKELLTSIKEINEDNVLLTVGTQEVKIGIKR